MRTIIGLAGVLVALASPAIADNPVACATVDPAVVRLAFETSPPARRQSLTTELPLIEPQSDGTCRATLRTHQHGAPSPVTKLVVRLLIVYWPCGAGSPEGQVASTIAAPGDCPWVYLKAYPAT
jgi:hypothetical protein